MSPATSSPRAEAQRAVVVQQQAEGAVLAPGDGRVLTVPVTRGAVVLAGEAVATIGGGGFFLRLAIPERHAASSQEGAADPHHRQTAPRSAGRLAKIYPQIENGRVIADVEVDGLGDRFVDARVLVEVPVGKRDALMVPRAAVVTRSGIDFVTLREGETDTAARRRARRGRCRRRPRRDPDRPRARRRGRHAMKPPRLGLAGGLTRAFITSPLTPLFLLAALALGLVALITLPREEEPQISVPMVDIHVRADGLKAEDAVKLVTEPLETIVKSIDGVEHVYSQTHDDRVMVTARFLVGTSSDAAILRVHEKVRANMDRIPVGIPEPLIVGRGIDDVAIVVADAVAEARRGRPHRPPTTSPASPASCRSRSPSSTTSA